MFPKLIIRQMKSKHGRGRTLKKGGTPFLQKGYTPLDKRAHPLDEILSRENSGSHHLGNRLH